MSGQERASRLGCVFHFLTAEYLTDGEVKVKQSRYTPWMRLGERRYSSYSLTTSELNGVSDQRHAPASLYPREKDPNTHCTSGWVGPIAGLDTEARGKLLSPLLGNEPRSPARPVRSQTLSTELPGSHE
jgi:hypothetical protein